MTALATMDPIESVPAAPALRPVRVSETRPWDRIAFRAPASTERASDHETGPHLVWPRPVPADLPEPGAWSGNLVRTFVEVLLGSRPPAQLARWLTAELYTTLCQRAVVGMSLAPDARRVRVLRVRTCRLDTDHLEAAVVLHDGRRVRAAAVRLESYRGRWRATALEIG